MGHWYNWGICARHSDSANGAEGHCDNREQRHGVIRYGPLPREEEPGRQQGTPQR